MDIKRRFTSAAVFAAVCALSVRAATVDEMSDYDYPPYDQGISSPRVIPQFTSVSGVHVVKEGNTTVLPCVIQGLGTMAVMWKRQSRVLTVKKQLVRADSRLRLLDGFNLEISQARPADAGVYTCMVALDDRDLEQTQTLEVHYGPFIQTVPESGPVIVEQGQNATMECHAKGNPKPRVRWRKKVQGGGTVVDLQAGGHLWLDGVTRSDAGLFECVADNGVGDVKTESIRLEVLYRPEVEVERSTVYTGEGFQAQLVCFVHADPTAEVTWTRTGTPISQDNIRQSNDVVMTSRHVLTITDVSLDDFDTYTCNATNDLGSSHGKIAVLGVADKVQITSTPMDGDAESYDLAWKVKSFSPVIEYKIAYRKTKANSTSQSPGRWKEVLVPTTGRQAQNDIYFHQQVTLRGLTPATAYDLHIQAKNKHGWNRVSDTLHFSTIGRALESRSPLTSDSSPLETGKQLYPLMFGVILIVISDFL